MLVDYLKFRVGLDMKPEERSAFDGGQVVSFQAGGDVEWSTMKTLPVLGSHDARVFVRVVEADQTSKYTVLEIQGCPGKFAQGHNLDWTERVDVSLNSLFGSVFSRLGLEAPNLDECHWFELYTIDVTEMYDLGDERAVLDWIRWASEVSSAAHRGRARLFDGETTYWGRPDTRYWHAKAYCKALEMAANLPKPKKKGGDSAENEALLKWRTGLIEEARGKLRVEVRIKRRELENLELTDPMKWTPEKTAEVMNVYLSRLRLPENAAPPPAILETMPLRIRGIYERWLDGDDLRAQFKRPTFYRYRRQLLDYGIDIIAAPSEPRERLAVEHVRRWQFVEMPVWNMPSSLSAIN